MKKSEFMQELQRRMPVTMVLLDLHISVNIEKKRMGLVVIDEVNGFCTPGAGNLAPRKLDSRIEQMIRETNILAMNFVSSGFPILPVLDTHDKNNIERPWPAHCIRGSGEDDLVPALKWLEGSYAAIFRKDCTNAFIGGMRADGFNDVYRWLTANRIEILVVVGICTDICVKNFVETMLAVRQHQYPDTGTKMVPTLQEVVVYEPACATFEAPGHPREMEHHVALHMMQTQGAIIAKELVF